MNGTLRLRFAFTFTGQNEKKRKNERKRQRTELYRTEPKGTEKKSNRRGKDGTVRLLEVGMKLKKEKEAKEEKQRLSMHEKNGRLYRGPEDSCRRVETCIDSQTAENKVSSNKKRADHCSGKTYLQRKWT